MHEIVQPALVREGHVELPDLRAAHNKNSDTIG